VELVEIISTVAQRIRDGRSTFAAGGHQYQQ
jgi:hypothetical protein